MLTCLIDRAACSLTAPRVSVIGLRELVLCPRWCVGHTMCVCVYFHVRWHTDPGLASTVHARRVRSTSVVFCCQGLIDCREPNGCTRACTTALASLPIVCPGQGPDWMTAALRDCGAVPVQHCNIIADDRSLLAPDDAVKDV